jgi:hypothetical protein
MLLNLGENLQKKNSFLFAKCRVPKKSFTLSSREKLGKNVDEIDPCSCHYS